MPKIKTKEISLYFNDEKLLNAKDTCQTINDLTGLNITPECLSNLIKRGKIADYSLKLKNKRYWIENELKQSIRKNFNIKTNNRGL